MGADQAAAEDSADDPGSSPVELLPTPDVPPPSVLRGLLALAWPLVLSNSFTTVQVTIDRWFLSRFDADMATASVAASMIFWLPFVLLWSTAGYVATFVAQYTGAGRHDRVGPATWQGIYFAVAAGIAFLLLIPVSPAIFAAIDHSPNIQALEDTYFRVLCWFALPGLITAAVSAFFSGRGESTVIIWINLVGTVVNAFLDYCLIGGNLGFPVWGIAGAGWATVAGGWASALLAVGWMLRKRYRDSHQTLSGWHFDPALFRRLCRFGIPSGAHWALDISAFNAFVILTGYFGDSALGATGLAITINSVAFIPMLGMGQAVTILVGQYLGENRPDRAERATWYGLAVAGGYMGLVAVLLVVMPTAFIAPFQGDNDAEKWQPIADHVAVLLIFVAAYSIFDAGNLVLSFGLRGAGDTLFVSLVSLALAWPVMVVPTYLAWKLGWGLYWAWFFASLYIGFQALCFLLRFRHGKWKSMRVIEQQVIV
ncbi:MAG TPA: MATE family efflux transporter [Gemmataceae bacterium]|nr:MATE family efflux transporter [Gemmataceae bacterium]